MNPTISLYSNLQNTDLNALSAFETLTHTLGMTSLKRLHRYTHFTLEFSPGTDAASVLNHLLQETFYLINPNKETPFQAHLPKPSLKESETVHVLEVSGGAFDAAVLAQLNAVCGGVVRHISKSLVWELVVEGTVDQDALFAQVGPTVSRTQGLLINPLYETGRWVDPATLYA
ncbi:MAG: hypothetical protein AB7F28_00080 [Candidatus Margulisiibacteriota bacterium]